MLSNVYAWQALEAMPDIENEVSRMIIESKLTQ